MKEKKVVREERNKEKLTSGDWVMAEFYSIHSLKSSRMHAVIDEFKKLMKNGQVDQIGFNTDTQQTAQDAKSTQTAEETEEETETAKE